METYGVEAKTEVVSPGTMQAKERDASIDLLRFIGLSCIILAHAGVAGTSALFQIRTFDVPLMIFISGLAYAGRSVGSYGNFAWRRTKRLLVPVYIFLIGYFIINLILSQFDLWDRIPDRKIWGSFMLRLNPSIGYVWVIRVFLIMMLFTPLLIWVSNRLRKSWAFLVTIACMLVVQEALIAWLKPMKLGWFVEDYLFYIIGYSVMFLLGMRMRYATIGNKFIMLALAMLAFGVLAYSVIGEHGTWLKMQAYKYPPHAYYVLWGCVGAGALWCVAPYLSAVMNWNTIKFIGQNTIWIYLWHIPFIKPVVNALKDEPLWPARYIIIYAMAVLVFLIQYKIVRAVEKRNPSARRITKYFVG